jgi:hypothetical protein
VGGGETNIILDMIDAEVARIRTHLDGALAVLATRDLRGVDRAARLARRLLVGALESYRDAGVFPRNLDHPAARPTFIDTAGTRCAMAHLLALGARAISSPRWRERRTTRGSRSSRTIRAWSRGSTPPG